MRVWISVLGIFLGLTLEGETWAIPEDGVSGDGFQDLYDRQVIPYFESHGVEGSFAGESNIPVHYWKFEVPADEETAALVIVPGKSETSRKYAELIYDLRDRGYSIYILDHRGQGASGRFSMDPQMLHVDAFKNYVRDLSSFIDNVVTARPHRKFYLLAHSMGAAIGTAYLEAFPEFFDAAVFTAPMYEINTGAFPGPVAYALSAGACLLGQGMTYAFTQGPYREKPFGKNKVTRSPERYARQIRILRENPHLITEGVSFRWIKTTMNADRQIVERAPHVKTPVLIFQAGQDQLVRPEGQNRFCGNAPLCKMISEGFEDSYHEILMERDGIRNLALSETLKFLSNH